MSVVIHRTTLELHRLANTPDFPIEDWIINPDLSAVTSVSKKYWKISVDDVLEMTQGEKDTVDATDAASRKTTLEGVIKDIIYPTIEPPIASTVTTSGLTITVDVVDLITNDQTTIVADGTDVKHVLASIVHDNVLDVFSVLVREYTTGAYAALEVDETLVEDLQEYTVAVNGTVLVEA